MNQYQKMKAQLDIYRDSFDCISKIVANCYSDTDGDTLRQICLDTLIRLNDLEK